MTLTDFNTLRLDGGSLPLDFVNTVSDRVHLLATEYLRSYADLLNWSVYAGALDEQQAEPLRAVAAQKPDEACRVLKQALELRDRLHTIFSAVAAGERPDETDLEALNAVVAAAAARRMLVVEGDGFAWRWSLPADALEQMLWIVAYEAAELLASPLRSRVRVCPAPDGCGWLFLDMSKNRSRRWCSMETCGNQAKARRHYRRHKTGTGAR
ncbi:MAG: ABATE domain-containing protein [Chloroflexota bacterium]